MNVQYRISNANATKWHYNLAQWQRPGDMKKISKQRPERAT
jgi:hypothetical protein